MPKQHKQGCPALLAWDESDACNCSGDFTPSLEGSEGTVSRCTCKAMPEIREASMLGIPATMKDNSIEFHMNIGGHIYAAGVELQESNGSMIVTFDRIIAEAFRFYLAHVKSSPPSQRQGEPS